MEKFFLFFIFSCASVSGLNDCSKEKISLVCQSSRLIHGWIDKINAINVPIVLFPGVEIVQAKNNHKFKNIESSVNGTNIYEFKNETIIGKIRGYLEFHEINIKLHNFLDTTKFLDIFNTEVKNDRFKIESRKKDDKMQLIALSLLFGKIITFLKLGSIGALAMKALGIASMALLLNVMLGLKSLQQSAEQTSHHVQYISDGHHRRRKRSIDGDHHVVPAWPFAH